MHLIVTESKQHVWVDSVNESMQLSPEFDTEELAFDWYGCVAAQILSEFGVTDEDLGHTL